MFGWLRKSSRATSSEMPEWRGDWLYALILRQCEEYWGRCNLFPDEDWWRYVLIEEWSDAEKAWCRGEVVRAWVRDAQGLREITLRELRRHIRLIRPRRLIHCRFFPFILVRFHIHGDRQRVALGFLEAGTAGGGWTFLVRGEGESAELEWDQSGGAWTS
jgi:hypothetical protein